MTTLMMCWHRCQTSVLAALLLTSSAMVSAAPVVPPQEVVINGVEFIFIPPGWFYKTGGITDPEREFQFRNAVGGGNVKVWLDGYYIAKFEARARDLVRYLNAEAGLSEEYYGATTSCSVRRGDNGEFIQLRPDVDLPATHLNWELTDRWARWMGFRLPSESEWEKAARGSDQRLYPWGDTYPDETYAGFNIDPIECFTWPVDSFQKGRSAYGLYNMAGNAREFVADWYSVEFDTGLKDGVRNPVPVPQGSTRASKYADEYGGPWKILKGGRWASRPLQLRIGYRNYYKPDDSFRCNGTRFALDVASVITHLSQGSATVISP